MVCRNAVVDCVGRRQCHRRRSVAEIQEAGLRESSCFEHGRRSSMRSSGYVSAVALMLTVFACTLSITVPAQPYPMRPIRFIVPYPPGGSTDYTAREIAQRLSELWGQQLVIDNRGGAGSLIGHALAANAPPDG